MCHGSEGQESLTTDKSGSPKAGKISVDRLAEAKTFNKKLHKAAFSRKRTWI